MDLSPEAIRQIFIQVFVLVVSICFHEFGHAIMADRLGARLGQTVVIDNRGGAGGIVGTRSVATWSVRASNRNSP